MHHNRKLWKITLKWQPEINKKNKIKVINLFDLFIYMFIFRIASLIVLSVVFRENSFMMMVVVVMMF